MATPPEPNPNNNYTLEDSIARYKARRTSFDDAIEEGANILLLIGAVAIAFVCLFLYMGFYING